MTIQLGEKEVTLDYITIDQYNRLNNEQMEDINFISMMTGLPINELREVELNQIHFVAKFLKTWVASLQKTPLTMEIIYRDQRLGLIEPKNMSYGEFSDLHTLVSAEDTDYKLLASILYRPIIEGEGEDRVIEKYDYDTCVRRSKDMGDFPINDYISALFFFTKYYEILLEDSHLSSAKEKKKMEE